MAVQDGMVLLLLPIFIILLVQMILVIGGKPYPGVTDESGLKPGFLVGQQYNEAGQPEKDRKVIP